MTDSDKVVINLATGLEDAERVTVAFLVGTAALDAGKQVAMFLTKEAIRLALQGCATGTACEPCRPLERLAQPFADGRGELLVCPICFDADADAVKKARRALPAQLADRVTYSVASGRAIELDPCSFDLVVFSWSL